MNNFASRTIFSSLVVLALVSMLVPGNSDPLAGVSVAAENQQATVGVAPQLLQQTRRRAIDYLRNSQADDGSWTTPTAPGITALVVTAALRTGLPAASKINSAWS